MPRQKLAFILATTDHGTLIVNRFDYRRVDEHREYGVGSDLLNTGSYADSELRLLRDLLSARRAATGDGVVMVDCGANIGVHTIELSKHMREWGNVIAIEAQERLFYALAGNIALNNCMNAKAILAAATAMSGPLLVPVPDYLAPGSFGSLELSPSDQPEFIGQPIDYSPAAMAEVPGITIDSLSLRRLDLIKIDVEGMELDVLNGTRVALAAHHPIVFVEHMKVGKERLASVLEPIGYEIFHAGINILAIYGADPVLQQIIQA